MQALLCVVVFISFPNSSFGNAYCQAPLGVSINKTDAGNY